MNKIWVFIILLSCFFGVIFNNVDKMIESLFMVPQETLTMLLKIGSMLVIYSGIFQIAMDAKVINKISKLIIKPVKKIFKLDDNICELICSSIIANMLGLGPANMAIAMKIMDKLKDLEKYRFYNVSLYLLLNISSLCVLPLSTLTFRATFNAKINLGFIPMLFIASFITSLFAIFLVKIGKVGDEDE